MEGNGDSVGTSAYDGKRDDLSMTYHFLIDHTEKLIDHTEILIDHTKILLD